MSLLRDGAQVQGRAPCGLELLEPFDGTFGACWGGGRPRQDPDLWRIGRRTWLTSGIAARHGEGREAEAESECDGILHAADVISESGLRLWHAWRKSCRERALQASLPASLACGEGGGGEWFLADQG